MSKPPAFQFYASDWRSDPEVSLMSLEEEGAYIRLLAYAWLKGSIPSDAGARAKVLRISRRKADRVWETLSAHWVDGREGELVNPRQEIQRREYEELRKKRAKAGRASAEQRAEQKGNTC